MQRQRLTDLPRPTQTLIQRLGAVLLAFVLLFNALVIQCHVHEDGHASDYRLTASNTRCDHFEEAGIAPQSNQTPDRDHCLLCEQQAHGTTYLPAPDQICTAASGNPVAPLGLCTQDGAPCIRSYHWSSRAPP